MNTNVIVRALSIARWCVVAGGMSTSAAAAGAPVWSPDVAPPAHRARSGHPHRADGYIWAPGYWDWNGHAYSWVSGRYLYEHRWVKAHLVADRWERKRVLTVQHVSGHWEH